MPADECREIHWLGVIIWAANCGEKNVTIFEGRAMSTCLHDGRKGAKLFHAGYDWRRAEASLQTFSELEHGASNSFGLMSF